CRQHPDYCEQVLPDSVTARVSVEQGATLGWARYVGRHGHSIGMETFGASAPIKELQKKFGFVPENIISAAKAQMARVWRCPHPRGRPSRTWSAWPTSSAPTMSYSAPSLVCGT